MPTTARCPTCKTAANVPADAEPGATITCPGCEEQFVPEHLKVKPRRLADDEADEAYGARKADGDDAPREREDGYGVDRRKKRRRRRRRDEDDVPPEHPLWNPVTLGILAVIAVCVLPLVFVVLSALFRR